MTAHRPRSGRRRVRRGDAGRPVLELVGLSPLVLVALLLVLQALSAVFAPSRADAAARAAARSATFPATEG